MRALASLIIAALMVVLTIQTASARLEAGAAPAATLSMTADYSAEGARCLACDGCPASQGDRSNCASTSVCASAVADLRFTGVPAPSAEAGWAQGSYRDASAVPPEPILSPPRLALV